MASADTLAPLLSAVQPTATQMSGAMMPEHGPDPGTPNWVRKLAHVMKPAAAIASSLVSPIYRVGAASDAARLVPGLITLVCGSLMIAWAYRKFRWLPT